MKSKFYPPPLMFFMVMFLSIGILFRLVNHPWDDFLGLMG
jgi:hypothetical protein